MVSNASSIFSMDTALSGVCCILARNVDQIRDQNFKFNEVNEDGLVLMFYIAACSLERHWPDYIIGYVILFDAKPLSNPMVIQLSDTYRGYPAKRALSAMRKHGG